MKTRSWSELFDGRRRKLTAVSKLEYGVCGWPLSLTVVITVFGWGATENFSFRSQTLSLTINVPSSIPFTGCKLPPSLFLWVETLNFLGSADSPQNMLSMTNKSSAQNCEKAFKQCFPESNRKFLPFTMLPTLPGIKSKGRKTLTVLIILVQLATKGSRGRSRFIFPRLLRLPKDLFIESPF